MGQTCGSFVRRCATSDWRSVSGTRLAVLAFAATLGILLQTRTICGTLLYMAPEIHAGRDSQERQYMIWDAECQVAANLQPTFLQKWCSVRDAKCLGGGTRIP